MTARSHHNPAEPDQIPSESTQMATRTDPKPDEVNYLLTITIAVDPVGGDDDAYDECDADGTREASDDEADYIMDVLCGRLAFAHSFTGGQTAGTSAATLYIIGKPHPHSTRLYAWLRHRIVPRRLAVGYANWRYRDR